MVNLNASELRKLEKELEKDASEVHKSLRSVIVETAFEVQGNARDEISRGEKTGYTYDWRGISKGLKPNSFRKVKGRVIPVKIRKKPHQASAKGEAPASDTGNLANSITVKEKIGLNAEVIAKARYSGYLEDDLDRPFMQPAYEDAESYLDRELNKAIERALR